MPKPALQLPPYGKLNQELIAQIDANPFPVGFEPPPGQDPASAWKVVFDALMAGLTSNLWAVWDPAAGWVGRPEADLWALTLRDLALMDQHFKDKLGTPVRQEAPAGTPPLPTTALHAEFFRIEDSDSAPLPVLRYLSFREQQDLAEAATRAGLGSLPDRVVHYMGAHCTAPTLPAKGVLQRPRPYQITSMLGQAFAHQFAQGAVTSALPSGHCIQGLIGVCSAYLEFDVLGAVTPSMRSRLMQYAVDHGDRRVYAGVHYPADNLASWCMGLALCDALYGSRAPQGRSFMVEAVKQHSVVYRVLRDEAAGSPHAPGLAWFDQLSSPPVPATRAKGARRRPSR